MIERNVLTLQDAEIILAAGKAKALEIGVAMTLVVVDHSGHPVAGIRMDESPLMALAMAKQKAYTAVGMGVPTSSWESVANENPSFAGSITSIHKFTPFGGGIPVRAEGTLVGALGVSGGAVEEDIAVAEAGVAAFG
ncbi:heme-binding protein [Nocardia speluncae]|uniref:Heme-binding protein n=1 Tax=Nocardia speluncae TaxID=419477 RepID=A0A846X7F9_9NOCA|nr:heme-binding protein [Nocardia speluncae]NKY31872.1 heme-binding protein [Nocardia speluncae]